MESEAHKLIEKQADRRIAGDPRPTFGDYWRTYAAAVLSYAFFWLDARAGSPRQATVILGILFVALIAARDSSSAVNRRIDAIVRQLERKGVL